MKEGSTILGSSSTINCPDVSRASSSLASFAWAANSSMLRVTAPRAPFPAKLVARGRRAVGGASPSELTAVNSDDVIFPKRFLRDIRSTPRIVNRGFDFAVNSIEGLHRAIVCRRRELPTFYLVKRLFRYTGVGNRHTLEVRVCKHMLTEDGTHERDHLCLRPVTWFVTGDKVAQPIIAQYYPRPALRCVQHIPHHQQELAHRHNVEHLRDVQVISTAVAVARGPPSSHTTAVVGDRSR